MPQKRKADSISNGKWKVLDLFAGCGGFSSGFENVEGFTIVAANEMDGTIASPSSPSVKFTALVIAKMTKTKKKKYTHPISATGTFTNGTNNQPGSKPAGYGVNDGCK